MSASVVSLIALLLAIVIGVVRKTNIGILCIGMAVLLGTFYQIKPSLIMKGFSTSLFLTIVGVTYLFSILSQNDSLTILASKLVRLVGSWKMMGYIMMFISGVLICAAGPGAIPSLAIIPVLALPIARSSGLNPILLCLVGQMGVQGGRMSPITPEAAVVLQLMEDQGLAATTYATVPIMYFMLICEVFIFISCFIYFKGWKVSEPIADVEMESRLTFNKNQIVTLMGLAALLICVLIFKMNVGLTAFLIGTILLALGYGNEKAVIKAIPWNIILMVLGVGMLMQVMLISGGVDFLASILTSMMTVQTAPSIMVLISGVMSLFSSGLGVVFPTLIPTTGKIAASLPGVDPTELVAMVVIGGTITGFSPISTIGALIMSAVAMEDEAEGMKCRHNQNILFRDLFIVAFFALIISAATGVLGLYRLLV